VWAAAGVGAGATEMLQHPKHTAVQQNGLFGIGAESRPAPLGCEQSIADPKAAYPPAKGTPMRSKTACSATA
jgi:hypothetical protein